MKNQILSHPNLPLSLREGIVTKNQQQGSLAPWKKAFTIIEVIIGIFIFSLWLVSVFMLFSQSSKMTIKSKNMIIATNLARENIELLKNLRDFNFKTHRKFDWIPNESNEYDPNKNFFKTWATATFYIIENKMSLTPALKVKKQEPFVLENTQLCLDRKNKYVYNCDSPNIKTDFYRYLKFEEAKYMDWVNPKKIPETYKVTSIVEWKKAGGWKIEIPFILANWKRL